jgi:hypothetical protein
MLSYSHLLQPLATGGNASLRNDGMHSFVRAAIQATPPGAMRMMSAGLMVELLAGQGLEEVHAKR